LPSWDYNYSARRDRLRKKGRIVSATPSTHRTKGLDGYLPRPQTQVHDRQVVTAAVPPDASSHLGSPSALTPSIEDDSRLLGPLCRFRAPGDRLGSSPDRRKRQADLGMVGAIVRRQSASFPLPLKPRSPRVQTSRGHGGPRSPRAHGSAPARGEGDLCAFAASPGQDRTSLSLAPGSDGPPLLDARPGLHEEVQRYHYPQLHATPGQIPTLRFTQTKPADHRLFPRFSLPQPYPSSKDSFCLPAPRTVNGDCPISRCTQTLHSLCSPLRLTK
jgi:hypothetical protein